MGSPSCEEVLLRPGERLDDLQRCGYRIIQDPERFCFGMDAVLLSDYVRARCGDEVMDLGTGTGIIPILLAGKTQASHLTGIEIQKDSVQMARRSVRLNGLEERVRILEGDIREAAERFSAASYDVITCNPPYISGGCGLVNADTPRTLSRHEILCTLQDVARASAVLLRPGGSLYLVHRPFRLVEIFATLTEEGLEPKRMRLVYPYTDREPNLVLLEARKGAHSRLCVERPLILYQEPGVCTKEVRKIYGD